MLTFTWRWHSVMMICSSSVQSLLPTLFSHLSSDCFLLHGYLPGDHKVGKSNNHSSFFVEIYSFHYMFPMRLATGLGWNSGHCCDMFPYLLQLRLPLTDGSSRVILRGRVTEDGRFLTTAICLKTTLCVYNNFSTNLSVDSQRHKCPSGTLAPPGSLCNDST